ncbi:MAG: phosphate ABC transporter substrate-binding protein [Deferrisomatales bacterium]
MSIQRRTPSTVIPTTVRWVAVAALALGAAACSKGGDDKGAPAKAARTVIQNKGSDTIVNLAQAWAEAYRQVAPDVEIEVSGGGSGVGLAALTRGTVDIANASREIKPQEAEAARQHTGKTPVDFVVGYDALAIYVHKDNPLEEITEEQIAQIYQESGTLTKWSDLGVKLPGGQDDIVRVSRQSSSGTYEFLREHVLKNRDFKLGSRDLNGSKEVVELVASTTGAIGYSGMGYATAAVKMLRVAPTAGATAVAPSVEATLDRSYPLARSLHLYTLGEPQGAVKAYLEWILSDAGQKIVEESGYVPVRAAPGAK